MRVLLIKPQATILECGKENKPVCFPSCYKGIVRCACDRAGSKGALRISEHAAIVPSTIFVDDRDPYAQGFQLR